MPKPVGPALKSFVPWYNVTDGILQAAGWEDFQSNRDQLKVCACAEEDDPILSLVQAWFEDSLLQKPVLGSPSYSGNLARFCDTHAFSLPATKKLLDGERCFDPASLSKFLSSHENRVFEVIDPDGGTVNVALVSGDKTKRGETMGAMLLLRFRSSKHLNSIADQFRCLGDCEGRGKARWCVYRASTLLQDIAEQG